MATYLINYEDTMFQTRKQNRDYECKTETALLGSREIRLFLQHIKRVGQAGGDAQRPMVVVGQRKPFDATAKWQRGRCDVLPQMYTSRAKHVDRWVAISGRVLTGCSSCGASSQPNAQWDRCDTVQWPGSLASALTRHIDTCYNPGEGHHDRSNRSPAIQDCLRS